MAAQRDAMQVDKRVRVGFILSPSGWLGGRSYLRNLFAAIRSLPEAAIEPVIFAGKRMQNAAADFPDAELVQTSTLDRWSPGWVLRKGLAKINSEDWVLNRLLRRCGVSVLWRTAGDESHYYGKFGATVRLDPGFSASALAAVLHRGRSPI